MNSVYAEWLCFSSIYRLTGARYLVSSTSTLMLSLPGGSRTVSPSCLDAHETLGISTENLTYMSPFAFLPLIGIPSLGIRHSSPCWITRSPRDEITRIPRPSRWTSSMRSKPSRASDSVTVTFTCKSPGDADERASVSCCLIRMTKITSPGGTPGCCQCESAEQ